MLDARFYCAGCFATFTSMIGRCMILLLISYESLAQTYTGPRYQAMGNTGTALQGIYSLTANPAGLIGLEHLTAGLGYQYHFWATDITTQTALLGVPTRLGVFGLSASRYGLKDAYDDVKIGFSFAKAFGPQFSIGLSGYYHQLFIPNYWNQTSLSVDVGVQYRFANAAMIGLHYANVGGANYGAEIAGILPAYVRAGVSYPLDLVIVVAEGVYTFEQSLGGRFGVEYTIGDLFSLRGGISINPMQQFGGFGVYWRRFTLDVAATFHPRLGTSPQIGICYAF